MSVCGDVPPPYVELLATSRRADWRFLLPHPALGHVACASPDPELERACRALARAVSLVDQESEDPAPASADILVLADPRPDALRRALPLVKPEGWVYLEAHGELGRRGARTGGRSASRYAAELRRLGFDRVECHWHWPDFASCNEMLPLADPLAIRGALARRAAARGHSPRTWFARLLLASGLLRHAVSHASVIARRPATEPRA